MDNRMFARIAKKHGPKLLERAIDLVADTRAAEEAQAARRRPRKPSLGRRIANFALLRVATRSVPGAILVSGGLIAKALYDRHHARRGLPNPGKSGK